MSASAADIARHVAALQQRDPRVQEEAAEALADIAGGSDQDRAAVHAAGALPLLVTLLTSGTDGAKVQAAGAFANLSAGSDQIRVAVHSTGALPPLVALLTGGTDEVKEGAAWALGNLTANSDQIRTTVRDAGALPPLVAMLTRGTDKGKETAAWALSNLTAKSDEIMAAAVHAAGALPPLVALLTSGTDEAKEWAVSAFVNLSASSNKIREAAHAAGALLPLVALLTTGTDETKEGAAWALGNFTARSDQWRAAVHAAGALPPLVALLTSGTDEAKEWAAWTLVHLTARSDQIRAAVYAAGALPPLVALLRSGTEEGRKQAATLVANLTESSAKIRAAICGAGAIPPLIVLLRSGDAEAKAYADKALRALKVDVAQVEAALQMLGLDITQMAAAADPGSPAAGVASASPPDVQRLQAELAERDQHAREQRLAMAHLQTSIFPQISRIESCFHDIPLASPIGMYVSHLLESTVAQHRVQLGQPDFAPAPRLRAVKIEKLVSERLYETYMTGIHGLGALYREPGCASFDAFPHLRVHPASLCMGRVDLNEHFVFHGATADVVSLICLAGFDPRRGGEGVGKLFGLATYFAVNSSKSDIYSEEFTRRLPRGAERKMIVARVILGQSFRVVDQCPQRARPPDGFDSVWADSRANRGCVDHPEIMIYEKQQALPQYVVTYVHDCPPDQLCAECLKRPPS